MRTEQKHKLALKRRWRIRQKISGTKDRPRMSVCFTNKNIHVQFIHEIRLIEQQAREKQQADEKASGSAVQYNELLNRTIYQNNKLDMIGRKISNSLIYSSAGFLFGQMASGFMNIIELNKQFETG